VPQQSQKVVLGDLRKVSLIWSNLWENRPKFSK